MSTQETHLGIEIRTPHHTVLFGGVNANFENIKAAYPKFQFTRIKQTHGDQIFEAQSSNDDQQVSADAQFSKATNLGLCISTADCVPVLVYQKHGALIAGIHAGWRGVANEIIPKTILRLVEQGAELASLEIYIGPHIQQASFEVEHSVREQLLSTLSPGVDRQQVYQDISAGKSLVDLNKIVLTQLSQKRITSGQIHNFPKDTFKDLKFHSHRRDKDRAGRQLSFICRHEP